MLPSDPSPYINLDELYISFSTAMRSIGRHPYQGSKYIHDKKIPTIRVAGRPIILRADWDEHVAKLRAAGKLKAAA